MTQEYSARVAIWLETSGQCVAVAQVGDESLLLRTPVQLAANQYGHIIMSVNGDDHTYPIIIRRVYGREVLFEQSARREAELQGTLF